VKELTYDLENIYEALGLDKHCCKILILMLSKMIFEEHPMQYNKLYRLIKASKLTFWRMSKSTFNDHIEHLVQQGYVHRKQIGKQNVVYFLTDKFPEIIEAKETIIDTLSAQKVISKKLSSMSVDQHAFLIAKLSTGVFLDQTRILIENGLKLESKRFNHTLSFSLEHAFLQKLQIDIVSKCYENTGQCAFWLEVLNRAIEETRKEVKQLMGIEAN